MLKQISVFAENKAGRLRAIMETLRDNGINLRAMTIADTADFGIVRLVADDTEKAVQALKSAGFTVNTAEVIGVSIPDESGALLSVIRIFEAHNLNIEYSYSLMTASCGERHADIVLRVSDNEKAINLLKDNDVKIIDIADIL
jgi:hypothetical protein